MNHIAVFSRWPEPGRVKTRLSPALPSALACELHGAMLGDALAAAAGARADARTLVWADAPADRSAFAAPPAFEEQDQCGADLGARLEHAFAAMLRGPDDRAVILGVDCPDLDAARIDEAFASLAARDLVLGPARDGGYYLIGLARPAPALFRGMAWGTPGVLARTLERAAGLGLHVAQLEALEDLDTPADVVRWLARSACSETPPAPRTAAALRRFGLLPPMTWGPPPARAQRR